MRGEHTVWSAGDLSLAAGILLLPFISWGTTPWLMAVFALLVSGAYLTSLPELSRGKNLSFPCPLLWIPLLGALILSAFHLARSPVPYSSMLFLAQLTVALVFYFCLQSNARQPSALNAVLIWTVLISGIILYQVLLVRAWPPSGPFFNPNYMATVLLSFLGYTLGCLVVQDPGRVEGKGLWAVALVCTAGLMMVGSRSAGIGLILFWIAFLTFDRRRTRWAAVAVIVALLVLPSALRHRVTEGHRGDPHSFSRIRIWKTALAMGADHPLAGVGPNLFFEYGPRYAFPTDDLPVRYGRIARKPHNEYLRSWAEGGVLGTAAALFFLLVVLKLMVEALRERRAGPVLAVCGILFMAIFHDLTESFALMALMFWWLVQMAPDRDRAQGPSQRRFRVLAAAAGVLVLVFSLWLTLDVLSRVSWQRGQRLVNTDINAALHSTQRAVILNPLLPGAARDLAKIRLMISRQEPGADTVARAQMSIGRARILNRLDSAPLRLHAAFYRDLASREMELRDSALKEAERMLIQASRLEPYNALIAMSLSGVYKDQGRWIEAMDLVNLALALEPNYLEAHRARIAYFSQMEPESVSEARAELERARERAEGYRPVNAYEEIILR